MGPPGDAVKQLVQSYRTGVLCVEEAPVPALRPVGVLVRNAYSLISPGTERAQLQLARASLLEKARQRPERLRQVVRNLRQEDWLATYRKVMDRLDTPVALGYCSAGVVEDVGREVEGIRVGHREELYAFLSAVAIGAPMPIPLDHLLATSLATLRVVESLQRRQPVEFNLAALDSQHD